jgi:tellurite resistance protein TerC
MFAYIEITHWHWIGFILAVLIYVALDLFVFHRRTKVVTFSNALLWTGICAVLAALFGFGLYHMRGKDEAIEFAAGYLIELSLSMDNVFVIALIFGFFRVPQEFQHRVLFFGFIDALIMRGIMVGAGTALVTRFHWILYIMGAFLIYSGVKMLFAKEEGVHPEHNPIIKLARKWFPISANFDGPKFFTRIDGKLWLTPLMIVLLMVETTDLIFAFDSIPAIFAVTTKPFIVFTSNIFAILGLRSLYFVLAGALEYFRYLKYGLAMVLIFVGVKMGLDMVDVEITTMASLMVVAGLILASMLASLLLAKKHEPAAELVEK